MAGQSRERGITRSIRTSSYGGASSLLLCAALSAALAAPGCAGEVEGEGEGPEHAGDAAMPIRGGVADHIHDAVVGLRILAEGGRSKRTCSGTLIAPNLVLTAQHCIAESPSRIACSSARFGELVAPGEVHVTPSPVLCERCDVPWFQVREVLRPPGDGAVCGEDVALLVLDSPVPAEGAEPLTPRLDQAPERGERYAAVGFGRTGESTRDSGVRRRLDALQVACVGAGCRDDGRIADSEWRGEIGACKGDSGGPALDTSLQVIGVDSRGRVDCTSPIYSELTSHRAWILEEAERAADIGGYSPPDWVAAEGSARAER